MLPSRIARGVNAPDDETSFGPLSVQLRRAARSLGYTSSQDLTETQRRRLLSSLADPNIFIAAKHLSDLRDKAFRGRAAADIGGTDMQLLGAMYNAGPGATPLSKSYASYGKRLVSQRDRIRTLLR